MAKAKHIEVYILASQIVTSKGPRHHGDRVKLPPKEADELKLKGFAK
jgi:hypothetical protein